MSRASFGAPPVSLFGFVGLSGMAFAFFVGVVLGFV